MAKEEIKMTKRDAFRKRISERAPELNMEDEDAYYGYMDDMVTEYDDYRKSSDAMRQRLEKSPALMEMLMAAEGKEDFNPVVWLVENKGLDIAALNDDPEYAKVLDAAHKKWLDKVSESEEIERLATENMPKSIDTINAKAKEMGLSDEQSNEVVMAIYQMANDLIRGVIPVNVFEMLAKGLTRDADVEMAREEGIAEGLNTKVNDTLRRMPKTTEQVGGRQTPTREAKPKKEEKHMFLA